MAKTDMQREKEQLEYQITNLSDRIEDYKYVLKLIGVPEIIIEYPRLVRSNKMNKKDIQWAKKVMKRFLKEK